MSTTPDHKFVNNFSVVFSALFLFMFVVIIAAVMIVNHEKSLNKPQDPAIKKSLEGRIKPVGDVVIAGQDKTLNGADAGAVAAAASQTTTQVDQTVTEESSEPASGEEIYNNACVACHGIGVAGAPKVGDAAQWSARIETGMDTLYNNAISGYTGSAGVMPAKGGRMDLSDEEVAASVDYMVEQSQ